MRKSAKRHDRKRDREAWFRERFQAARERLGATLVLEVERAKPPAPGFLLYATEGSLGAKSALELFGFSRIGSGDARFPAGVFRRYVKTPRELEELKATLAFALPGWRVILAGPASVEAGLRAA